MFKYKKNICKRGFYYKNNKRLYNDNDANLYNCEKKLEIINMNEVKYSFLKKKKTLKLNKNKLNEIIR